jgi:hypothetical protein
VSKGKHNIIVTLILLIFVGQASASAVVYCPMQDDANTSAVTMSEMNHDTVSQQILDDLSMQSSFASQDCCDDVGSCYMAGCFFPGLSEPLEMNLPDFSFQALMLDPVKVVQQFSSSLYRPPILA